MLYNFTSFIRLQMSIMSTVEAIIYENGKLQILNQLLLPKETVFEEIRNVEDGWHAIKQMKV